MYSTAGNLAYKEEPRTEIIGGKVVALASPSIDHSRVTHNIDLIFGNFLRGKPCEYFPDGVTVELSEDERFIPDGMVVCDPDKVGKNVVHGAPDLVIEVLSPATARNDRGHKKDTYEKRGIREYWIVNPRELSVEQYVLTDGHFELRNVYHKYMAWELEYMKPEERTAIVTEFRCSLFDGLTIRVDDIFDRVAVN